MDQINLIHGDCLEKMQDIPDGSIDFILTDPPYGTTACSWDTIIPLEPMWKQVKRVIKDNGAIALFSSQPFTTVLISSNMKMFKYEWIWEKTRSGSIMNATSQPMRYHENIIVFANKTNYYPIKWEGNPSHRTKACNRGNNINNIKTLHKKPDISTSKFPRTIIKINSVSANFRHPTQKPVKLLDYLIRTYTNENETVLDFTCGSGSTGVACIETNRNFIGIELDENYFKIATDRIDKAKQSPKLFY